MLNLKSLREDPDLFRNGFEKRGVDQSVDSILEQDEELRKLQTELQDKLTERNTLSKDIGQKRAKGEDAADLMNKVAELKKNIPQIEMKEGKLSDELTTLLMSLPNLPHESVPIGNDESNNVEVAKWGEPTKFDFSVKDHVALGEEIGGIDFEKGAQLSGARFVVLRDDIARLERAIGQFMIDFQTREKGYRETSVPILVKSNALLGTGQLPKFSEDLFQTTNDYYLIPTAEVPLTNLAADQILAEVELPIRVTALTPCFRSEAGAAGKDTRGILRQHQFYKVELVSLVTPEESSDELERMTGCAEDILRALKLPYRKMLLCTGDMGFSAQKTYDLEVWLPGQETYREISSCSNCGEFQARRMKARYRKEGEKKPQFIHTLNGSGLAVGRTLIAVMENYQKADGSIEIPEVLRPYMGGQEIIKKA